VSQKITITTKIQKDKNAIDKVEYQWHWNRIALVCFSLVLISACVIWGLLSGFFANETSVVSSKKIQSESPKRAIKKQPEKMDKLVEKSPQITENIIKEERLQQATQSNLIKSEPVSLHVTEIETVKEQKNDALENKKVIHSSTFLPKSHLSKISQGGLIDIDYVTRAVLTTAVMNKEPVDVLGAEVSQSDINEQLFFFTELNNMKSQKVSHRWFFEGTLMAEVELNIFSARYRTHSSKKIMVIQSGNWRVELVNAKQDILASKSFHIK